MTKVAYRVAGAFCCVICIFLLGCAAYFPFFTIMAFPGKTITGTGALIGGKFSGNIGIKFLINGGPT